MDDPGLPKRRVQHLSVKERDSGRGLVLCRGARATVGGQRGEKNVDFGFAQQAGVPLTVVDDEAAHPARVRTAGAVTLKPRARTARRTSSSKRDMARTGHWSNAPHRSGRRVRPASKFDDGAPP